MTKWTKFERAHLPELDHAMLREQADMVGARFEDLLTVAQDEMRRTLAVYVNSIYQVSITRAVAAEGFPMTFHLSIKRIDREPIHDWRDLQRIKNELVGRYNEGFELYPSEKRVVDTANQYHLWVFADPNTVMPVGWTTGMKFGQSGGGAKQRPFDEETLPCHKCGTAVPKSVMYVPGVKLYCDACQVVGRNEG